MFPHSLLHLGRQAMIPLSGILSWSFYPLKALYSLLACLPSQTQAREELDKGQGAVLRGGASCV